MISDEVKVKVNSIIDTVVTIAEQEAVKLILKNTALRQAFKLSGCYYHHKRDRKKYRQIQMRAKRHRDKKTVQAMAKKLKVHQQKSDSIRDHRREIHRVETELRRSLQKQNEMESEMKRLRHKYVVA